MQLLKQSTSVSVTIGPILDADGVAVTGAVVGDVKIAKAGAAPASLNASATLTHRHTGHYSLGLTAADVATVGTLSITLDKTTDAMPIARFQVVEESVYDRMFAASAVGPLTAAETNAEVDTAISDANLATAASISGLNDLDAADIRTALGMAAANLDTQLDAIPTANENADALLDRADGIETGWPLRKAMRIILAGFGGKLSGANTTTNVIRDVGDTKARITATTDAFGNRSAMTLDGD